MESNNKEYISRKSGLILKDYDSAFHCYNRHHTRVASIRTWSISFVLALGFSSSIHSIMSRGETILLGCVFVFLFLILEIQEKIEGRKNGLNICEICEIYMIQDDAEYEKAVSSYKFRDLKLPEYETQQNGLWKKYATNKLFMLWYGFLFGLCLLIPCIIRCGACQ